MGSPIETEVELAKRVYSARASNYEDSWHPEYTDRFMALVNIKPGERILALCCGTGLEIDIAAPLVGEEGKVVGVDVVKEMLAVAKQKLDGKPEIRHRVQLIEHDVCNLQTCPDIEKASFDWILCSSAFVLFETPRDVLRLWKQYLRPGGRMAIDITHEHNLVQGRILETVAKRLEVPFPSDRAWITSRNSFKDILEAEGLTVERLEEVEKTRGKNDHYYDVSEANEQFDQMMNSPWSRTLTREDIRPKARLLFAEEWKNAAVNGKVKETDTVYVYVAMKPE